MVTEGNTSQDPPHPAEAKSCPTAWPREPANPLPTPNEPATGRLAEYPPESIDGFSLLRSTHRLYGIDEVEQFLQPAFEGTSDSSRQRQEPEDA